MYQYETLAEELRKKISACLNAGQKRFPSQEALCREYQVSRVTVRRALQILESQGYLMTRQGSRSMLTGLSPEKKGNEICLLMADPEAETSPARYREIRQAAAAAGLTISMWQTDGDYQKERSILTGLLASPEAPRGLIAENLFCIDNPNKDLYRRLIERGTRVVLFDGRDADVSLAGCIREDIGPAAAEAVARLAAAGHKAIAGVFHLSDRQGIIACSAYLQALRDHNLSLSRDRFLFLGETAAPDTLRHDPASIPDAFLQEIASTCTAVLCQTDYDAYLIASRLSGHGIHIPQHMSLISLGVSYLRGRSPLHIDSFEPVESPGSAAVRLLLGQMKGEAPETISIGLRYLPGNSLRKY